MARLYLKRGDRVADVTFGRGVFWQKVNLADYVFYRSDKITCPGSPYDFRRLPYKDNFLNAVAFDPPYCHHADSLMVEANYNNAATTSRFYHSQILQVYRQGMTEAHRVLKPGGLLWVKCADEIETSRQRRGHIDVYNIAMELGFQDQDLFILMRPHAPVVQFKSQRHSRKNCSFLWIFKKPGRA